MNETPGGRGSATPAASATTVTPMDPRLELSLNEQVGYYVDLWKKAVDVQQHFNDIEWRIRGLALTVATFAFGAAGVGAKDNTKIGPLSLGTLIILLGLLLWYAFYFVDRVWYHPLLKAAVAQGEKWEQEFQKYLPLAGALGAPGMTSAISAGSAAAEVGWLTKRLSRKKTMHSAEKLVWFYGVGSTAFVIAAIALQIGASIHTSENPAPVIVRLESTANVPPSGPVAPSLSPTPTPSP